MNILGEIRKELAAAFAKRSKESTPAEATPPRLIETPGGGILYEYEDGTIRDPRLEEHIKKELWKDYQNLIAFNQSRIANGLVPLSAEQYEEQKRHPSNHGGIREWDNP